MKLDFVNRELELRELDAAARRGGLLVVYGRRRVGKTRLVRRWLDGRDGLYSQAIEAGAEMQIRQLWADIAPQIGSALVPRTWRELLELLRGGIGRRALCIPEFPYLAAQDPSLPSQLQKWIDHSQPRGSLLILAGSSTRMMGDLFLNRGAPLFGRAQKLLAIRPMSYAAFCDARDLDRRELGAFEKFSCVGGVPRYWEFVEKRQSAVHLAESLFFDFAPYMEQEPDRLLRDEGVSGLNAISVLEAVGRGAERPSQIASRLATAQTNLSRLLQQLLDAALLQRELPFGESTRSTRKVLYRIQDPAVRFWFRVYSPHRSRWPTYAPAQKRKLVHDHAATVFEDYCRAEHPGASRYWDANREFDLVAIDPQDSSRLLVAEVKFRIVSAAERQRLTESLRTRWHGGALRTKYPKVRFAVLDATILG